LSDPPLVSIGMPVYNGERFLRLALDALLAQDHRHFELIISDNGSQDSTEQICCEFQGRDSRIRYIRHSENRGAPWNFNFVLQEASADYFMWAACDDLWHPTYVRKCLSMLESHPQAVLCCTEINFIDGQARPTQHYPYYSNLETLGMTPVERIRKIVSLKGWFATYGLMRNNRIPHVPPGTNAFGWDVVHLLELSLVGPFVKVPEALFNYRILGNPNASSLPATPYTGLASDLLGVIYCSALSSSEKTEVFADFILAFQTNPWRVSIIGELIGPNAELDNSQYSLLLGLILNGRVPSDEIKRNPLSAAIYRSVVAPANLIRTAEEILSKANPWWAQKDAVDRAARQFDLGNLEEAANLFEAVLKEHQTSNGWSDWATVQLARGRTGEAEEGLRRALRLDPHNAKAEAKLGILIASLGRTDEAIPYLERSVAGITGEDHAALMKLLSESRTKSSLLRST
jgi:glycosyltransferase involved in cell wall biosynthesis